MLGLFLYVRANRSSNHVPMRCIATESVPVCAGWRILESYASAGGKKPSKCTKRRCQYGQNISKLWTIWWATAVSSFSNVREGAVNMARIFRSSEWSAEKHLIRAFQMFKKALSTWQEYFEALYDLVSDSSAQDLCLFFLIPFAVCVVRLFCNLKILRVDGIVFSCTALCFVCAQIVSRSWQSLRSASYNWVWFAAHAARSPQSSAGFREEVLRMQDLSFFDCFWISWSSMATVWLSVLSSYVR